MGAKMLALDVRISKSGGVELLLPDQIADCNSKNNPTGNATTVEMCIGDLANLGLKKQAEILRRTAWPKEGIKTIHLTIPDTDEVMKTLGF